MPNGYKLYWNPQQALTRKGSPLASLHVQRFYQDLITVADDPILKITPQPDSVLLTDASAVASWQPHMPLARLALATASARLVGRGDGGAGDMQEIVVGSGLAMTGQTLSATGSGSAPDNAQYVTLATNATLTNERVLTGTTQEINITDNGAGSTVVLSFPQRYSAGNSGTALTINWNNSPLQVVTLTGNVTFTFSNPINWPYTYRVMVFTGAGGFTATWPGSVLWPGGVAPVVTVAAGKTDVFEFLYDGTNYCGSVYGQNY